jgi:hypothetical protein
MKPDELMQKVAHVAPQKYSFFVKAAAELKDDPFVNEVKEELDGIMKKAQSAIGNFAAGAGRFLGGVGAAAGTAAVGGIALALAGDMYGAAKRGLTKSRNYRSMLEANPDLREVPAERVQRAFSTLHRLNPTFSADPTVAGSYVRSQSQSELAQWNPQEMKGLVDSHKTLQDINRLPNFDPRSMGDPEMRGLQMEKLRQDTDPDFQYEKNRPLHELQEAQKRKTDLERMQMVDRSINDRGNMANKARGHRPFSQKNNP